MRAGGAKRGVFVFLIGLAFLAGGAAYVYVGSIQKPPVSGKILVSGNLELATVEVAFKTSGRLQELLVREGQTVTKGMELARLDSGQIVRQRERELAALASAGALVEQARSALQLQVRSSGDDREVLMAELRAAEARLRELKSGARPQELTEALAAVNAAKAELERAEREYERAKRLRQNDDIPAAQLDQHRSRYESAKAVVTQTEERLALLKAGARPETVEAAEAQVARARAALNALSSSQIETKRRMQEIDARRADSDRAKAQLGLIDLQLEETRLVAPMDAVVLVKSAEVGEILAAGASILTIGDLAHPWLRAYIGERDLGRVKLGARARITTDSYPGKVYEGRVSFIASDAEFTPNQIQTKEERTKLVYRIKIEVANPRQELKANMPVDAEVLVEN